MLLLQLQKHLPCHAAVTEVTGRGGAQLRDVLRLGKVHFEEGADAGSKREEIDGGLSGFGCGTGGDAGGGGVRGFDRAAVRGENASLGEDVDLGGQVA